MMMVAQESGAQASKDDTVGENWSRQRFKLH